MDNPPDTHSLLVAGKANGVISNREAASSSPETRAVRPLSLRRNFGWSFAGNLVSAACQWAMLAVLAKLCPVESLGDFGLAIAISTPLVTLTNLHLRAVYVTDATRQYCFGEYLGLRLLTVLTAFIIVLAITILSGHDVSVILITATWCLAQCAVSVKDSYLGIMQKRERMDKVSLSKSVQALLSLSAFTAILFLSGNLLFAICGVLVVRLAVLLCFDMKVGRRMLEQHDMGENGGIGPHFHWSTMLSLLRMTLPLGVVLGMVSWNNHVPRYFIEAHAGRAMLGYFTALASFIVVGNMFTSALAQAAAPRLAVYYIDNIAAFRRLLVKLGLVGLVIGVAGVLVALMLGRPILSLFFKPAYAEYADVLVLLMVAGLPYYVSSFLNNGLLAGRWLRVQVPLNGAGLFAVLIGSWLLVPTHGLMGAAWAILAGSTVTMLGTIALNWSLYKVRREKLCVGQGILAPAKDYADVARNLQ